MLPERPAAPLVSRPARARPSIVPDASLATRVKCRSRFFFFCKKAFLSPCRRSPFFPALFVAQGFDEYMNLVLDDTEEVNKKKGTRKSVGRILLKGDNITMMVNVSDAK